MEEKVREGMIRGKMNLIRAYRTTVGQVPPGLKFFQKHSRAFSDWINSKVWLDDTRTLDDESLSIGMTRDEMNAFCRYRYGMTFLAFRAFLRVSEATEIMRSNPELPIQDVSLLSGFSDRNYLERRFEEYFGMTASVWRARCRKNRRTRA